MVCQERGKIPSMITDSNQVRLAKMAGRRVQEVLNEISFPRFLEQVDGRIWRVHKSSSKIALNVDDY